VPRDAANAAPDRPDVTDAPDVALDAAPDVALDATLDVALDVAPDRSDVTDAPDAALDVAPDAAPERPDVPDAPDAAPDRADAADVPVDRPPPPPRCVGPACVLQVVAGNAFACARYGDGTAACWGDNTLGQIGDGTFGPGTSRDRPTAVLGLAGVEELAAGASHVCARVTDGSVWCWGANGSRQVGSGRSGSTERNAVRVAGLTGAVSIACGAAHSCAVLADGAVRSGPGADPVRHHVPNARRTRGSTSRPMRIEFVSAGSIPTARVPM
jgi:hypothetical protein